MCFVFNEVAVGNLDSSMGGPWTTLDGVLAVVIYYTIRGFLACPSTSRRLVVRSSWGVSPGMFFASVRLDLTVACVQGNTGEAMSRLDGPARTTGYTRA